MVALQMEAKATFPLVAPLKVAPAAGAAQIPAVMSRIPITARARTLGAWL